MICPNCNTPNRENAKFCDSCGYELPTVAYIAQEMFTDTIPLSSSKSGADLEGIDKVIDSSYVEVSDSNGYGAPFTAPISQNSHYSGYGTSSFSGVEPTKTISFASVAGQSYGPGFDQAYASGNDTGHLKSTKAYLANEGKKKKMGKGPKAAIIVALCMLLLGAIAAAATYYLELWGGIAVPDVTGRPRADAIYELETAGFIVQVKEEVSDGPADVALSTSPAAGFRAPEGSEVILSIAVPRTVPEIIGMTQDQALARLAENGYQNIVITTAKSNEPEGTIVSCDPSPGTTLSADQSISVVVAEPYRVPDVTGMSREAATEALQAEGYVVDARQFNTEDVPEGNAVSTEPAAGSALNSGSTVILNVAHNRSTEVVNLTRSFFDKNKTFLLNGMPYELVEVKNVSFSSGDTCSYTIIARKYETKTWTLIGNQTETRYGNNETIEGSVTWNSNNSISSSNPTLSAG